MKLSDAIKELQDLLIEHGDLNVMTKGNKGFERFRGAQVKDNVEKPKWNQRKGEFTTSGNAPEKVVVL